MGLMNLQPVSYLPAFKKLIMDRKAALDGAVTSSEDKPSPSKHTALGERHDGGRKCLLDEVPVLICTGLTRFRDAIFLS